MTTLRLVSEGGIGSRWKGAVKTDYILGFCFLTFERRFR